MKPPHEIKTEPSETGNRAQPGKRGRRKPVSAALGAGLSLALLAGACGGSSGGSSPSKQGSGTASQPVTITFANWAEAEAATRPGIDAIVQAFEASHPSIRVKMEPISFTDIGHTLVLQVRSGNTPDVAELSGNDTFSVAAAGGLQPLAKFATGSYTKTVLPNELNQGKYQGSLIAIPWTDAPTALWYNKTILAQAGLDPNSPPTTINALLSDMKVIKAKEPKVIPLGLDTTNRAFGLESNWPWMKSFDAIPFQGTKVTANTPGMVAYLNFLHQLQSNGYIEADKKIGDFRPLAAANEVAFTWDQPLLQGVIQKDNKQTDSQFYSTWGVASLPTGPSGQSYSSELGHQMAMFKNSKYQAADWTFMNWLTTSTEAVKDYTLQYESSLPPLTNPDPQIAGLLNTPVFSAFSKDIVPHVTEPSYGSTFSSAYTPVMAGIESAVTGSTSSTEIAKTMQSGLTAAVG
jgi:multiple sugar transport system substrate-binding protein